MYDKIKISLPSGVLSLLQKDCEDFLILKENGAPNMNAFINTLVMNFYEAFSADEESLHDEVERALFGVPEIYKKSAFDRVVKLMAKAACPAEEKNSCALAFKPTKASLRAVIHIENVLSANESLSSFYRRMFTVYSQKTKTEREKIICKENYAFLTHAAEKGVQVFLSLKNGIFFQSASVYAVAPAQDELFSYVLLYSNGKNHTIRLAKINTVSLLTEKSAIPDANRAMFDKQVLCGAQYPIYSTDYEPIKVQLTEKGKALFQKIYLYRPVPTSIEGDVYTFECSANQVLYYFERFGDNALILAPKRLGIFMRNYYYYALKKYRSIYKID